MKDANMWIRFLFPLLLCLTLSGCFLESKKPLFSEEQGEPALAAYGTRFAVYTLDKGDWKKGEELLTITPVGRHYVLLDGDKEYSITLVPIGGQSWALQVQGAKGSTIYYLADFQKDELLVYDLGCDDLQKMGEFGKFIEFKEYECSVKEGADTKAMFESLAAAPRTPDMKLIPAP